MLGGLVPKLVFWRLVWYVSVGMTIRLQYVTVTMVLYKVTLWLNGEWGNSNCQLLWVNWQQFVCLRCSLNIAHIMWQINKF